MKPIDSLTKLMAKLEQGMNDEGSVASVRFETKEGLGLTTNVSDDLKMTIFELVKEEYMANAYKLANMEDMMNDA